MDKELDEKLVKSFPLLYRDRYASMQQTCACWGFSFGKGWYQIVYDLSTKLEPLIQKFIDENSPLNCICGCVKAIHNEDTGCRSVFFLSYSKRGPCSVLLRNGKTLWDKFCNKVRTFRKMGWIRYVNRFLYFMHEKFNVGYNKPCWCKKYVPNHPCASQMKEKFGTLRFYMSGYLPEFDEHIDEAEKLSAITCEECGEMGILRNNYGWLETRCDKCAVQKDGTVTPPYDEKDLL